MQFLPLLGDTCNRSAKKCCRFLHQWALWLTANGLSAKTVWDYGYALMKFAAWPGDENHPGNLGRSLNSITDLEVTTFLACAIGAKAHSRQQYVKALRSFYRHPRRGAAVLACYALGTRRDIDWDAGKVQEPFSRDELAALVLRAQYSVPSRVIQDFLGHENVSTTGIYLGLFDGDQADAVQAL